MKKKNSNTGKDSLKKSMKQLNTFLFVSLVVTFFLQIMLPLASAYSQGIPAMNLWELFIDNVFGNFWIAVVGIMVVYSIILALGGISMYTNLIFNGVFLFSMSMGYGYPLITVPFFIAVIFWSVSQMAQFINRIGY